MSDYIRILAIVTPVVAIIGAGAFARWQNWLRPEAEESLLKVVVNLLFPCLVFRTMIGNPALHEAGNLVVPPLVGFVATGFGFFLGYQAGRLLGLKRGQGLRTFAVAVGVFNYGYIPIPIVEAMYNRETLGVLLVHNVGCDFIVWTIGIVILAGGAWRETWRKAINPPAMAIVVAVTLNAVGIGEHTPAPLMKALDMIGVCAVPVGLIVTGGTIFDHLTRPRELVDTRVTLGSAVLRLLLLPVVFLIAARSIPFSIELKRVMVVQAAMPAGVGPLIIARHYGGHPLTAAQVILGTTVIGVFVIPWWIKFGSAWVGV